MGFDDRLEVLQQCLEQVYPGVITDVGKAPLMPLLERCERGALQVDDLADWQGALSPIAWLNLLQSTLTVMDDWCERLGGDRGLLEEEHYEVLQYFAALTANFLSYVALYDADYIDYPLSEEDINRLAAKDMTQPTRLMGIKEFWRLYHETPADGGRHEALLAWLSGRRYFKSVRETDASESPDQLQRKKAHLKKIEMGEAWQQRAGSDKISSSEVVDILLAQGLVAHAVYRETKYLKPLGFKPGDSMGSVASGVFVVEKTKTANLWLLTAEVEGPLLALDKVDYPVTSPSAERYGRNSNLQKISELAYAPVSKFKIKTVAELRALLAYLGLD